LQNFFGGNFIYETVDENQWSVVGWFNYFFSCIFGLQFKQFKHQFLSKSENDGRARHRVFVFKLEYDVVVKLGGYE